MAVMSTAPVPRATDLIEVEVARTREIATDVLEITLAAANGDLPPWEPGAHIGVVLGNGAMRQYSLCGTPGAPRWRIAVLREVAGRGGSKFVHENVVPGQRLSVSPPRNNFPLRPATSYVLVAGGIGITPLLAMAARLEQEGKTWRLLYGGRTRDRMSFRDELEAFGDKVEFWPEDERGLIPFADRLRAPCPDSLIYCCGPAPLIQAVESAAAGWPAGSVQVERFGVDPALRDGPSPAFEIVLARSGKVVEVSSDISALEVLEAHGVDIASSCREGTCGTCEVAVLDGQVDHRDVVLDDEERAANDCMFVCCSRALTPQLVLDL